MFPQPPLSHVTQLPAWLMWSLEFATPSQWRANGGRLCCNSSALRWTWRFVLFYKKHHVNIYKRQHADTFKLGLNLRKAGGVVMADPGTNSATGLTGAVALGVQSQTV